MWPNPQILADLVTFTEEILNGKLHTLHSGRAYLGLYLTSVMGLFAKTNNGSNSLTIFEKKLHHRSLTES